VSDLRNYANYITAMIALWRNEKKSRHLLKNKKPNKIITLKTNHTPMGLDERGGRNRYLKKN